MRYRRLGRTDALVSEIGITGRALQDLPADVAADTLRAAFAAGVSLVALDAREDLPDIEELVGEVAGTDRPRLTVITVFSTIPPADALAPAIEAAAVRLGAAGYVDVVALPPGLTEQHLAAYAEVRARGTVRHLGIATSDAPRAIEVIDAGWSEVLVAPLNVPERLAMRGALAQAAARDLGVVLAGRVGNGRTLDLTPVAGALEGIGGSSERAGRALVAWGLSEAGVDAVAAGARSPEEIRHLVAASPMAPLDAAHLEALERAMPDGAVPHRLD